MGLFNKEAPAAPKAPEVLDNVNRKVIDDLKETIRKGSKVSIAAASFSIYAFEALKKELSSVDEFRFLFTGETFTKEKAPKEAREFYIPRLDRERSLYGTNFEVRLRNELNQQAIAKECADWIRKKAHFRSNISGEMMLPFMNIENPEENVTYNPFANFTTAELGEDRGNNAYSTTMKVYAPLTEQYLNTFNQVWNDNDRLADVTDTVLENITAAYKENSPEFIYFVALYNIFSEFLEDIDDFLHAFLHHLLHRFVVVELRLLVKHANGIARREDHFAVIGFLLACNDTQQGGFTCSVQTYDADLGAIKEGEIDVFQYLS